MDISRASEPAQTLSQRLREGTAHAHREAESTPWATALATASAPAPAYAAYLEALVLVYDALEPAVARHASHPALAPVADPRLHRGSALRGDLRVWGRQEETADAAGARLAAERYAARIGQAADQDPSLLVAHHYVRYLGDLSGGQVIASAWRRRGLHDGLALYDFSDLETATGRGGASLVPYVRGYRASLDRIPADHEAVARLVDEAVASFQLTTAIFEALAPLTGD